MIAIESLQGAPLQRQVPERLETGGRRLASPELRVEGTVIAVQSDEAGRSRLPASHCVHESIVPANLGIEPCLPDVAVAIAATKGVSELFESEALVDVLEGGRASARGYAVLELRACKETARGRRLARRSR